MHDISSVKLRMRIPGVKAKGAHPKSFEMLHIFEQLDFTAARTVKGH